MSVLISSGMSVYRAPQEYGWVYLWGFPKIGNFLGGVPVIRAREYWGLYCGPPILGSYHTIGVQLYI